MAACAHVADLREVAPRTDGCEECLASGGSWVQLRMCLTCGHVGCCDSSAGKHASGHFRQTQHPAMQSLEPNRAWRYCYVDHVMM